MRLLLLFLFIFTSTLSYGQTKSDIIIEGENTDNKYIIDKLPKLPKFGRDRYKPNETKYDYLEPCFSDLSILLLPADELGPVDEYFNYKNWQTKEIIKNLQGINYLDIRIGWRYDYYLHFREDNDTVQILKMPGFHFWRENSDSIELKSEFSTFVLDKKLHIKFRDICSKAVGEANYSKQRKLVMCCAMPTVISVNYKSATYSCTYGYKTNLLQHLIGYGIEPMLLQRIPLEIDELHKWADELLQAYELE